MSEKEQFELKENSEFIELIKLLKIHEVAQTGGHGKIIIEDGLVHVNGEQEFRKRKKLRKGDLIEVEGRQIEIV
ncbi:RNA-binding S4 domain-containing protein [Crocinitomix catalasitica]|uniref:RNA-binding S4 domain-containing protein n=1 Tax=Crocinitomix catalasitica TaxID=184607 RepID=UPI0004875600|nr:RNA-binding S4 domain-containing protein [Crocinitomix catalasitica]